MTEMLTLRTADLLCPRHQQEALILWPNADDPRSIPECPDCRIAFTAAGRGGSIDTAPFPAFSAAQCRYAIAVHEAGHVIGGLNCGASLRLVTLDAVNADGSREVSGRTSWNGEIGIFDAIPMNWAGAEAQLRWMRSVAPLTDADVIDVRYGAGFDAADIRRWSVMGGVLPDGWVRGVALSILDARWDRVIRVADALAEHGELSGAEVAEVLA